MAIMTPATRQIIFISSMLAMISIIAGCSSRPSKGDGKQIIQDKINNESEGRIELISFKKTNGLEKESFDGRQLYTLEYDVVIEFTEDCKWLQGFFSDLSFHTDLPPKKNSGFSWGGFLNSLENPGRGMKKGQRLLIKGVIDFEKTDTGWRSINVQIKSSEKLNKKSSNASIKNKNIDSLAYAKSKKEEGINHLKNNKTDNALNSFNNAIKFNNRDAEVYLHRGYIYGNTGEPQKALDDFTKAIDINHNYSDAYYNRAFIYFYFEEYKKSLNDINRAIAINPT